MTEAQLARLFIDADASLLALEVALDDPAGLPPGLVLAVGLDLRRVISLLDGRTEQLEQALAARNREQRRQAAGESRRRLERPAARMVAAANLEGD